MARPIALIDMDGTIADFDGAMTHALADLRSPAEDARFDATSYEDVPHMKARRRLIKSQPGFWLNLEPLPVGFEIVGVLKRFEFELHVLTKGPSVRSSARDEKVRWCEKHLPGVPVTISDDKSLVYGKILVDDWPPYFTAWLRYRPRGLVVVPAQPWNEEYTSTTHPQIIRYELGRSTELIDRVGLIASTIIDTDL